MKYEVANEIGYQIENELICKACSFKSAKLERNFILSLALPDKSIDNSENDCTINSLLESYFKPEEIDHKCEKCNDGKAIMRHHSKSGPSTLILHLVRFEIKSNLLVKRNDNVLITNEILKSSYVLTGIVAHLGNSISAGHYVYYKRQRDGLFTKYDDQKVVRDCEIQQNSKSAYLVVYSRIKP